jgi:hypothetical protein
VYKNLSEQNYFARHAMPSPVAMAGN